MPDMPALLVVAHGTRSEAGARTTADIVSAVAAARPDVEVSLCFLDVAEPTLAEALAAVRTPTVVVPLLLSTGYHVLADIPGAVAGIPLVRVARHLGPDPMLVGALLDRLVPARGEVASSSTVLVGAGSTRPEAADELARTAELLGARLGRSVPVLTMGDDLVAAIGALPPPVEVATYLLAEGQFVSTLRAAAIRSGSVVADPIGVHPALVSLVWSRYDDVAG